MVRATTQLVDLALFVRGTRLQNSSHTGWFISLAVVIIVPSLSRVRLCTRVDKTIKLWKLFEKKIRSYNRAQSTVGGLAIPSVATRETVVAATPRRVFANAHAYHINAISINSDGETYISADDLRINLWDLEISDQSFSTSLSLSLSRDHYQKLRMPVVVSQSH